MVLCRTPQNEAADFKLVELPVQLTSDWVVTLQLNSVHEVTQELPVMVARPGSSEAGSALQHSSISLSDVS